MRPVAYGGASPDGGMVGWGGGGGGVGGGAGEEGAEGHVNPLLILLPRGDATAPPGASPPRGTGRGSP